MNPLPAVCFHGSVSGLMIVENRDTKQLSRAPALLTAISLIPRQGVADNDSVLSFLAVHTPRWFCQTGSSWTGRDWWSCRHSSAPGEEPARPLSCFHGFYNQRVRLGQQLPTWESSCVDYLLSTVLILLHTLASGHADSYLSWNCSLK